MTDTQIRREVMKWLRANKIPATLQLKNIHIGSGVITINDNYAKLFIPDFSRFSGCHISMAFWYISPDNLWRNYSRFYRLVGGSFGCPVTGVPLLLFGVDF